MSCRYQAIVLAILLFLSYLSGGIGGVFVYSSLDGWYAQLKQPPGAPPNEAFPLVWSVLYFLFGLGAWLGWRKENFKPMSSILGLFLVTLCLETFWTYAFFSQRWLFVSIAVLILSLASTIILTLQISRRSRWGAVCLIPQNLWLTYATYLNIAFWAVNTLHRSS